MRIGIPKETKSGETRVAVAPAGVRHLVKAGHEVCLQSGAGRYAGWSDTEYRNAGARIRRDLRSIYQRAELICKVKEPQSEEIPLLRKGQVLFTFLHLAGNRRLLKALQKRRVVALAYETVERSNGQRPLLNPMSEVAGRVAVLLGADFLRSDFGGKGILLSSVVGSSTGTVGIIGCGHVGQAALQSALGLGATVWAVDANPKKLASLRRTFGRKIRTFTATTSNLRKVVSSADLLIGAVLIAAKRPPRIITASMVKQMQPGSVIVDVAIDQGGCVATSRPTSIANPLYEKYGVLHCAIPNLPALVPRTASQLLATRVQPYLIKLAKFGWEEATRRDPSLRQGLNLVDGAIMHPALR